MESFDFKKLNKLEDKEQYHVKISDRFAAFVNLDAVVNINKAWETIRI
jgi:hypothetical protein